MMLLEESYREEKEVRERRLAIYMEQIQKYMLECSKQIIEELVVERHRQNMPQQEIYAAALGKHIEIQLYNKI